MACSLSAQQRGARARRGPDPSVGLFKKEDANIQDFSCLDQFFGMAFAQLTYRESLRDIEVSLRAQARRLYRMGFRCQTISRNTLANANATRPWQVYADCAGWWPKTTRENAWCF